MFASASQRPFCSHCEFLPWDFRLAKFVAGVRESYDRMDVCWPTE